MSCFLVKLWRLILLSLPLSLPRSAGMDIRSAARRTRETAPTTKTTAASALDLVAVAALILVGVTSVPLRATIAMVALTADILRASAAVTMAGATICQRSVMETIKVSRVFRLKVHLTLLEYSLECVRN